jgi:hypothetical protein
MSKPNTVPVTAVASGTDIIATMKAQDIMSNDNNRQDAIDKLITFCMDNNLNYSYTDKAFSVVLPGYEELPTNTHLVPPTKKRDKFNISDWGPRGVDETNLPDPEKPLTEGEQPPETL